MKFVKANLEDIKNEWIDLLDNSISKNIFVSIPWL